jgi:site-specific DNA recombinase
VNPKIGLHIQEGVAMRTLSIIRISSEDQKYGYGPDSQWEDDIQENAEALGLEVSEEHRICIEERATDWDRAKFTDAINQAIGLYEKGVIQAVVFPRVDRESWFVFSSMPLLSAMLKAGLQVYFAREKLHLNPKDPEAVEIYLNKVGQSQAYVKTMRINTMRGRRRAIRDGLLPTGGVNLYGYYYDKSTGKRVVNTGEAAVVSKMVDWVLKEGISLNEVCRRLMADSIPAPRGGKCWSRATVGRILNDEVYTGKTYALKMEAAEPKAHKKPGAYKNTARRLKPKEEWIELPDDPTPAIISMGEVEALKKRLVLNRELSPRNKKNDYMLRGFVYCHECGRKHYGVPVHGKRYYRCSGRTSLSTDRCYCSKTVNADQIERRVWAEVSDVISNPDRLIAAYQNEDPGAYTKHLNRQPDSLKQQLTTLDSAETRLIRLYESV